MSKDYSRMTREDLELELISMLSTQEWHDISEASPDPEATRCLAVGFETEHPIIYVLFEYQDERSPYSLVAFAKGQETRLITNENLKLGWLRENLIIVEGSKGVASR